MFKNRKPLQRGLTEVDETVLFLTRPYVMITLVCWVLSLYCIINTGIDHQSLSFILSSITLIIDSLFLVILIFRAKRIRRKTKEEGSMHF